MTQEAIILCGGFSRRLKPHIEVSKPLLQLKPNLTLVDYQIRWLRRHGFQRIILAGRDKSLTTLNVEYSLETEKLGTGGALKKASRKCKEEYVYALNVDDILLGDYNPKELEEYADRGGAIVIAKPRLKFGKVQIEEDLIVGFEQKPYLDFYVSAGHYTFKTELILKHFPEKGDFENQINPKLASMKMLRPYKFDGLWLTINTYKEALKARKHFQTEKQQFNNSL